MPERGNVETILSVEDKLNGVSCSALWVRQNCDHDFVGVFVFSIFSQCDSRMMNELNTLEVVFFYLCMGLLIYFAFWS